MHHNMAKEFPADSYRRLEEEIAVALCTDSAPPPCPMCRAAALRVVAKRRTVRRLLIAFAQREADA